MKKILLILLLASFPVACVGAPPTSDISAVQTQAAQDFAATLTAEAPSPTLTLTPTPTVPSIKTPLPPTPTPIPPTPTSTRVPPTPTPEPPTPTVTPIPPTPTPKPLFKAEFINALYHCVVGCWGPPDDKVYGYRGFQVDLVIANLTDDRTIPGWEEDRDNYWKPSKWVITDGTSERELTKSWVWVRPDREYYEQPSIGPGETQAGTWMAFPIGRYEWVKAAEFEWWGQVYRQEFDLGPLRNNYDYRDCGEEWVWKKECETK